MTITVHAYAAKRPGGSLEPWEYELGEIADDEVEIEVEYCGVCRSDLSMLDNSWRQAKYPFVPGHEIIGRVAATGRGVTHLAVGTRVGVGWVARSCLVCDACIGGHQNLCPTSQGVIVGRHGGFADRVRCQGIWAFPLPEEVRPASAGPLFCGGATVFSPMLEFGVRPTDRVAVVGIGGLGHLGIQFLRHWGCEVTAFSSTPDKQDEAEELGAHHFVATRDESAFDRLRRSFDFILVTANAPLPWDAYLGMLAPGGRLHIVGAAKQIQFDAFSLIAGQRQASGSPVGSPLAMRQMLAFCARHNIEPVIEHLPMSRANDAMERLRAGKPRYRIVLEAGK